jgi:SAM-dependent methyltransferase
MDDVALLVDLHRDGLRQGPGGDAQTRLALALSRLEGRCGLRIADVGCGTGASTKILARELDGEIIAVDLLAPFLEALRESTRQADGLEHIETLEASMEALPFEEASLDAIWSEGAIYNMGFARGVREWARFIRPGGILAVSELTWLTAKRPRELQEHWSAAYPEVDTASAKLAVLEENGFSPLGYFPLPEQCWLDNYYRPLEGRFEAFLARHGHSPEAQAIVAEERREIALYETYSAHISYGFYIARRLGASPGLPNRAE